MTISYGSDRGYDTGRQELAEKVVHIRRVAKVVKGGRRLSFNAMVVVGDGNGRVGIGLGKGTAVPDAVRKGTAIAKKHLFTVPMKGSTIPHAVRLRSNASEVLMKPAAPGTGVIAGGAMRAVMEMAGVKDVVAKALGSRNPINLVKATMAGLAQLKGGVVPEVEEALVQPEPVSPPPSERAPAAPAGPAPALEAPEEPEAPVSEAPLEEPVVEAEAPALEVPVEEPAAQPEALVEPEAPLKPPRRRRSRAVKEEPLDLEEQELEDE